MLGRRALSPAFALLAFTAHAQTLGLFSNQSDIGNLAHPGIAEFAPAAKTYTLTSGGADIWGTHDDFHFLWKKLSGDVTLTADIAVAGHAKAALMIRRTLDPDSDYADAALHAGGLASLQSRDQKGGITREVQSWMSSPKHIRLVKSGGDVFLYLAAADGVFHLSGGSVTFRANGPFYIGLAACAHDKNAVEKITFSNVQITNAPLPPAKTEYSTLEVQTGERRALWVERGRIESPHFTTDGKWIVFNNNGVPQKIPATGGNPQPAANEPVMTDRTNAELYEANKNFYYDSGDTGTQQIWRGTPTDWEQLTNDSFDSFNPHISTDGKLIAFLSRDLAGIRIRWMALPAQTIRIMGILPQGGELGSSPWSPDSKSVAYVSHQYLPE